LHSHWQGGAGFGSVGIFLVDRILLILHFHHAGRDFLLKLCLKARAASLPLWKLRNRNLSAY
jgi:hypothetical protein